MSGGQLMLCVLVLGVAAGANSSTRDYSPCTYGPDGDYTHEIYCNNKTAAEVVDAFRRNKNNPNIDAVLVSRMGDDMTAGILEEILEMVADSASHKVRLISLFSVPRMKTVPKAVQRFDHLRVLSLDLNDGLKVLRSGSFVFPSNSPPLMYSTRNPNLKAIQPGAFQGNFNGTFIGLWNNNIKKLDEAVFKPLLAGSTAEIDIYDNPFVCKSCSLAWLIRDRRQYLPRIRASCIDGNGKQINIGDADPGILRGC